MKRLRAALLELPYSLKRMLAIILDVILSAVSVPAALYLRLGELPRLDTALIAAVIVAIALTPALLALLGAYRILFRYAGSEGLIIIARATALYGVPSLLVFTLVGVPGIPRTFGAIQPVVLFLLIGGSRAFISLWLGEPHIARTAAGQQRILIYGAGQAGRQLCAGLSRSRQQDVLGFVDDAPALIGRTLDGKRVYGPGDVEDVHARLQLTDVLIALPSVSRSRRAEIIESVRQLPIRVRILPGLTELASGSVSTSSLREVRIDDLLGREVVPPNDLLLSRNVRDKVLLVTGAGGSIGSEMCRQVLAAGARRLILVDCSEYALYAIHQELSETFRRAGAAEVELVPVLASVCDAERMEDVLRRWRPDTIYHAAAYKHVPLIEENPIEGMRNNVLGTLITAELAARHGVSTFILISSDKAVRPTNVMGATKRLAEHVLQALAPRVAMCVGMVRFGNVLGSSGSVVPLFHRQIGQGGPVTVTHRDIIRYFIIRSGSIGEAALQ